VSGWLEIIKGKLEDFFPAFRTWVNIFEPIEPVLKGIESVIETVLVIVRVLKFVIDLILGVILMTLQRLGSALGFLEAPLNEFRDLSTTIQGVLEGSLAWFTYSGKVKDLQSSFTSMFENGPPEWVGPPADAPQAPIYALVFAATLTDPISRLRSVIVPEILQGQAFREFAQQERERMAAEVAQTEAEFKAVGEQIGKDLDKMNDRIKARAERVAARAQRALERKNAREAQARQLRVERDAQAEVTQWLATLESRPPGFPSEGFFDPERAEFVEILNVTRDQRQDTLNRALIAQAALTNPDKATKDRAAAAVAEAQEAVEVIQRAIDIVMNERLSEEQKTVLDRVGLAPLSLPRLIEIRRAILDDVDLAETARSEAEQRGDTAEQKKYEDRKAFLERVADRAQDLDPLNPVAGGLVYQGRFRVKAAFEPLVLVTDLLDDAIDVYENLLEALGILMDFAATIREGIERILLKVSAKIAELERLGGIIVRFISVLTTLINKLLDALSIGTIILYRYQGTAMQFGPDTGAFFGAGVPGEIPEPDSLTIAANQLLDERIGDRRLWASLRAELLEELEQEKADLEFDITLLNETIVELEVSDPEGRLTAVREALFRAEYELELRKRAISVLNARPLQPETAAEIELANRLGGYPPDSKPIVPGMFQTESLRDRVRARLVADTAEANEYKDLSQRWADAETDETQKEIYLGRVTQFTERAAVLQEATALLDAMPNSDAPPDGSVIDPTEQLVHMLVLVADNEAAGQLFGLLTEGQA
jgi:hypothetical protein